MQHNAKTKRRRAPNFSPLEVEKLTNITSRPQFRKILENRKMTVEASQDKIRAWHHIKRLFNEECGKHKEERRTTRTLRTKYKVIKREGNNKPVIVIDPDHNYTAHVEETNDIEIEETYCVDSDSDISSLQESYDTDSVIEKSEDESQTITIQESTTNSINTLPPLNSDSLASTEETERRSQSIWVKKPININSSVKSTSHHITPPANSDTLVSTEENEHKQQFIWVKKPININSSVKSTSNHITPPPNSDTLVSTEENEHKPQFIRVKKPININASIKTTSKNTTLPKNSTEFVSAEEIDHESQIILVQEPININSGLRNPNISPPTINELNSSERNRSLPDTIWIKAPANNNSASHSDKMNFKQLEILEMHLSLLKNKLKNQKEEHALKIKSMMNDEKRKQELHEKAMVKHPD